MKVGLDGAKLILMGNGRWAELTWYQLTHETDFEIAAFCVDASVIDSTELCGLPVIPFEEITTHCSPENHAMLNTIGFLDGNRLRASRYQAAKNMGYGFISHISPKANVWPNLAYGENVVIHEQATLQPFVKVGNDTQILSGSTIFHHSVVGDHCFVAGGVTIAGGANIGDYCVLGANSFVKENVSICSNVFVGAGATVLADIDQPGTYIGTPARRAKA